MTEPERTSAPGGAGALASPLAASRAVFEETVARSRGLLESGDLRSAAVWAQVAAHYATYRHTGLYASEFLEATLIEMARRVPPTAPAGSPAGGSSRRRILHVLTRALPIGGHTRVVERWIRNDPSSVHDLVATAQTDPLPPWLARAVAASGGSSATLALPGRDLLSRAAHLRALARGGCDAVVLHAHPYDVVPPLAFGVDGGPPVLLFNHSDATFWLGARGADAGAELRPAGRRHSLERRGVRHSEVLPIPLTRPEPGPGRDEARRRLPPEAIVREPVGDPARHPLLRGSPGLPPRPLGRRPGEAAAELRVLPVRRRAPPVYRGRLRDDGGRDPPRDHRPALSVRAGSRPPRPADARHHAPPPLRLGRMRPRPLA